MLQINILNGKFYSAMKIYDATFSGYKRLKDTAINLNRDLLAIIGPNEAGKSSLLEALSSIENNNELSNNDLTHGEDFDDNDTIVFVRYKLNKKERTLPQKYGAKDRSIKFLNVKKKVNGKREFEVHPQVYRDKEKRQETVDKLNKALNYNTIKKHLDRKYERIKNDEVVENKSLRKYLEAVEGYLATDAEDIPEKNLDFCASVNSMLKRSLDEPSAKNKITYINNLSELIEDTITFEWQRHPRDRVIDDLLSKRPKFLNFTEKHRNLSTEYSIDVLNNSLPLSLQNLFDLAEIDTQELRVSINNNDLGNTETICQNANQKLKKVFEKNWGQYDINPRLDINEEIVRIFVRNKDNRNTVIAERSDGLKSFIALCSYIHAEELKVPPILLIDEAETHLHYDAQADLIRMFEQQEQASNIFYTTHSAGALPNDLGTGIRVVKRKYSQDDYSVISRSFWNKTPGFSSILFAMGANIMSFVPTRRGLIGEGPSEMILLPTLLREVSNEKYLDFQVAPGLSQVKLNEINELELEAPKVSYFVDGDEGGEELKNDLISNGINEDVIIQLENGYELEDYVDKSKYCEAVNYILDLLHDEEYIIEEDDLGYPKVTKSVSNWCDSKDIEPPSKVRVADRLVTSEENLINKNRKQSLKGVYEKIAGALDL